MSLAFIHNLAYGLEDGLGTVNDATRAAEQYTKHEEHTLSKPTDDSLDGGQHHVRKTGAMSLPVELLEQILGYVLTDNESLTIRLRKAYFLQEEATPLLYSIRMLRQVSACRSATSSKTESGGANKAANVIQRRCGVFTLFWKSSSSSSV